MTVPDDAGPCHLIKRWLRGMTRAVNGRGRRLAAAMAVGVLLSGCNGALDSNANKPGPEIAVAPTEPPATAAATAPPEPTSDPEPTIDPFDSNMPATPEPEPEPIRRSPTPTVVPKKTDESPKIKYSFGLPIGDTSTQAQFGSVYNALAHDDCSGAKTQFEGFYPGGADDGPYAKRLLVGIALCRGDLAEAKRYFERINGTPEEKWFICTLAVTNASVILQRPRTEFGRCAPVEPLHGPDTYGQDETGQLPEGTETPPPDVGEPEDTPNPISTSATPDPSSE